MPEIKQYDANKTLVAGNEAASATAQAGYHAERTAEIAPRLWEQGLDSVSRGFKDMDENQARAQTTSMLKDVADLTVKAHAELNTRLNSADPNSDVNPMEGFATDLQTKLQAVRDKYSNDKAQDAFDRTASELTKNILDSGMTQWNAQVRGAANTNLQQAGTSFANAAALDPASVDKIAGQYSSQVDLLASAHPDSISQDDIIKLKRQGAEGIYNSAGIQLVNKINANPNASLSDIAAARTLLAGDNFKKNMSPEDYQRVLDDLDKAGKVRADAASMYLEKSAPDLLKQVEQFGDADGRVGRLLAAVPMDTPEHKAAAAQRADDYTAALASFKVKKQIGDMPEDQVQQYIQAAKQDYQNAKTPTEVKEGQAAYDTAVKVAAQRDAEFKKSPAMYMLKNNDTIGALYANYQKDPTPDNFQTYATFSVAQQQKLYPHEVPQVLSDDMKQDIGGQMAQAGQTPDGPLKAAAVLTNLQKTTGTYYTSAVHELMKDKIIRPDQYVAGVLINRPESQMLAQEVLRAAAVPSADMEKASPLSEAQATTLARNALAPLASTLKGTINGDDLLNSYISATADVLRQRAVYGGTGYLGAKDSGAVAADARALATQMVLGRYNVKMGMRIPKELDAGDVTHGATSVLNDLGNHKLVASPYYGNLIKGGEQFAKDVASDGYWVTNPKGDGAVLYFQGAPVQETSKNGMVSSVQLPFKEMARIGKENRGALDKAKRFFTNPGSL